ncbi:hypothetical protein QEN19_003704 [Hanseniaspora menglaensis]
MNSAADKKYDEIVNFKVPVLKDFDSLLRCHICKDILNIPVITPCCHTFCSVCIRDYLRNGLDQNCPLCLNDLNESSLRSELLLNEICKCYRLDIKKVFIEKLNTNKENKQEPEIKNIISNKRKQNKLISDSFSLLKPQQSAKKQKTASGNNTIIDMLSRKKHQSPTIAQETPTSTKEKSNCPICNNKFSLKYLQEHHIDHCLSSLGTESKEIINLSDDNKKEIESSDLEEEEDPKYLKSYLQSALQSNLIPKIQKLPNLQLNDITTTTLKQNLMKYNLPVIGSKFNLIQRWKQWDVLYTSNFVDNPSPLPITSVRNTLIQWDALNNKAISANSSNNTNDLIAMLDNKKLDIKSDKFSRPTWESKYKKHYKELIKVARKTKTTLKK